MKRTVVNTGFPYPLIWDRGRLDVRLEDGLFEVHFRRVYRQSGDGVRATTERVLSVEASDVEMPYDRLARVAYTVATIWFPAYVDLGEPGSEKEIRAQVHAVINRILGVYRFVTGEFHVDAVPLNELWDYEVFNTNEDGRSFPSPVPVRMAVPQGYGVRLARAASIPEKARRFLKSEIEPPVTRVLYLNARRERLLENHRLAVVEAETAFEVLVDQVVAEHYRAEGMAEADIERKLNAGLRNLLEHHVPNCCGDNFVGTPEHSAWYQDLYRLRNAVVHGGASVGANEAEMALRAAEKALGWLEKRCGRDPI